MVTAALCEQIVAARARPLDGETLAAAGRLLLDGLAVGVAGSAQPTVAMLVAHHLEQGSAPSCTLLGRPERLGPVAAAAVNGAAIHVLDYEPMWSPANHALSTTMPVVLALAEQREVTGAQAMRALVHGIEVQGRLRQASRQWEAEHLHFHPPGLVGPLGAAVAAADLLGLDAGRLRHALGIAASRCGGLMANVGTMTKATHCGQAAANGLEAALLAARGFTADVDVIEAPRGLRDAFWPELALDELLPFAAPYRVVRPGFAVKLFPCQYGTHFGITAALQLHGELGAVDRIEAVRIVAPPMAYVDRPHPPTGLAGKFSLQYTVAVALLDGAVGLGSFEDAVLHRPELQQLLERTTVVVDPAIPGRFESMWVDVEVDVASGPGGAVRRLRRRCEAPAGRWDAAALPEEAYRRKATDCLVTVLEEETVAALIGLAGRVGALSADELRRLIGLGAAPAAGGAGPAAAGPGGGPRS